MTFGQKLKDARSRAGLTQEELVRHLGVTRQTISNWENDRSYPDLASALTLSELYGISLDELLKEDAGLQQRLEEQRERTKRRLSGLHSLGMLLIATNFILVWLEQSVWGIILGIWGLTVVCAVHVLFVIKLGADRREAMLRCFALVLVCTGLMIRIQSEHTSRLGDVLWIAGMSMECWCDYRMNWGSFYPKHMTAFTGFVIALVLVFAAMPMAGDFIDQGDHVPGNPFNGTDYRVAEVIAGDPEPLPMVYLGSTNSVFLQFPEGSEQLDGKFRYIAHPEETGVWEMRPESDPDTLYRVTLEADDRITMGCYRDSETVWAYLLEPSPKLGCTIRDPLSTSVGAAEWYYGGSFDPEHPRGGFILKGKGTIRLSVPGDGTTVTIQEEFREGNATEHRTLVLTRDEQGFVEFERETRDSGEEQIAFYRIPYEDGEFVLILKFIP